MLKKPIEILLRIPVIIKSLLYSKPNHANIAIIILSERYFPYEMPIITLKIELEDHNSRQFHPI